MTDRESHSSTNSLEATVQRASAGCPPAGKRGMVSYRVAAVAATFLGMTLLSLVDLIEVVPSLAPLVAAPLFSFVHETHDILAAMLAVYVAHRLTPTLGAWALVWLIALHVPYAYFTSPESQPELARIALTWVASFLGVYIISLRIRAEERLRLQANALDAAANAIMITDHRCVIEWVNPAFTALTGYTTEEVMGKNQGEFLKSDCHDEAFDKNLWDTILSGQVWRGEIVNRRNNGTSFTEELAITPVRDNDGAVRHFIAIMQDITSRKQRELEREAITTVSRVLRTASSRAEMLSVILDQVVNMLKVGGALLAMRDPTTGETTIELGRGSVGQNFTGFRLAPGEGVTGLVIATGQPYLNSDVQNAALFARPALLRGDTRAMASVPLIVEKQTIGALCILDTRDISADEIRLLSAIADMAANAIYRVTLYEQTERRLQHLSALRAVDMAISSSLDLLVTLNILLDQTTTHLRVDAADILLLNPYTQTLDYVAGRGFRGEGITRSHLRVGECQAGRAALERRTMHIPNLAEETNFVRAGLLINENFVAYYVSPFITKGEVKGVVEVFHRAPLTSDPEWVDFLEALAGQSAIAIDNAELFDGLQRSNAELTLAYDATIDGWSRALDLRDKETEGHTQRVAQMTVRLARTFGMGEQEIVHVRRGALLHDIGKMGVPDAILLKAGKLTDDEWIQMKKHPQFARDMLASIGYLRPALDIPYGHHEKWDGTGYPLGLKGEQIPLAARLFAVVDVYDALMSDRPYRAAWSVKQTVEHITSLAGSHFEPQVVDFFLTMMRDQLEIDGL